MLKKEFITKISTLLKIKEEDITKAIADEKEVDIPIDEEMQVFTKKEIEDRDTNTRNEGIKTGKEIGAKEVKKAAGLDEAISKDPAKIAEAIRDKAIADAKIKPDEKVNQLTEQVTLLQKQLGEKDGEITKAQGIAAEVSRDRKILSMLPKERSSVLTDDEYISVIKSKLSFKEQDGSLIVEKDGQILRDAKTQNPLPVADAIGGIFKERNGWLNAENKLPAGRGGKDNNPAGGAFTKKSEVIKHYQDMGKNVFGADSQEVVDKLSELAKADSSFDLNS